MKPTVTIGITVLNEEKNICSLVTSLLAQKELGFKLSCVHVISDGSIDRTVEFLHKKFGKNKRVKIVVGTVRLGKPTRVNQIFANSNTSIVVNIDGDVSVKSEYMLSRLIDPILKGKADLTSGKAHYLLPQTFFERVMGAGIDIWCEAKDVTKDAEMYTCEGQIRAFSQRLYSKMRFPQYSAEDVFPYLYSYKKGYAYRFVRNANVYYGLPSTLHDFFKQHTRFLHSKEVHSKNFNESIITSRYVIGTKEKASVFLRNLAKSPLYVSLYGVLLVVPKILVHFERTNLYAKWTIINSTKK